MARQYSTPGAYSNPGQVNSRNLEFGKAIIGGIAGFTQMVQGINKSFEDKYNAQTKSINEKVAKFQEMLATEPEKALTNLNKTGPASQDLQDAVLEQTENATKNWLMMQVGDPTQKRQAKVDRNKSQKLLKNIIPLQTTLKNTQTSWFQTTQNNMQDKQGQISVAANPKLAEAWNIQSGDNGTKRTYEKNGEWMVEFKNDAGEVVYDGSYELFANGLPTVAKWGEEQKTALKESNFLGDNNKINYTEGSPLANIGLKTIRRRIGNTYRVYQVPSDAVVSENGVVSSEQLEKTLHDTAMTEANSVLKAVTTNNSFDNAKATYLNMGSTATGFKDKVFEKYDPNKHSEDQRQPGTLLTKESYNNYQEANLKTTLLSLGQLGTNEESYTLGKGTAGLEFIDVKKFLDNPQLGGKLINELTGLDTVVKSSPVSITIKTRQRDKNGMVIIKDDGQPLYENKTYRIPTRGLRNKQDKDPTGFGIELDNEWGKFSQEILWQLGVDENSAAGRQLRLQVANYTLAGGQGGERRNIKSDAFEPFVPVAPVDDDDPLNPN